jgi:hypothetical protein
MPAFARRLVARFSLNRPGRRRLSSVLAVGIWLAALAGSFPCLQASLQFDVFLGFDGTVREAAWFPVTCEVYNDGPSFNAVVELTAGGLRNDQVCRVPVELPTNTRKRFIIPVFAGGGRFSQQWNARLLDERGKVYAEHPNLQPKFVPWEGIFLGALSRTFAGTPSLPENRQGGPDLRPQVARLQLEQFPDNPIALEALDAVYLNSEKALGLKINQVAALLAWVQEGGRLIVSVEQLADVNSTPWLHQFLPAEVTDMANVTVDEDLQQWVRQESAEGAPRPMNPRVGTRTPRRPLSPNPFPAEPLAPDPSFVDASMPVATGQLRDGRVLLAAKGVPLIIEAVRGRGQVTLLTFSPEREPFRSWKNRAWFWSKLMQVPPNWYWAPDISTFGGWSLDGVFGALIDSRQLRKLPVEWLLLLLIVYLIVIGPFDQYWLKKINRQMLTWITFPTYVVLFSLLIYFIGYKLRAGETEWNQLQIVDVLPRGVKALLRGRTFASIYSSANAKYQLAFNPPSPDLADQSFASLRGEMLDLSSSGEGSPVNIEQHGNAFRADIFVPVWTSLLYVNDWFEPGRNPLSATLTNRVGQWEIEVENHLERPLTDARLVLKGSIYELGSLPAHEKKSFPLEASASVPFQSFVVQHASRFQDAVQYRRSALGNAERGHLEDLPLTSMVASFPGEFPHPEHQRSFVAPPGLDLTPLLERGNAILLAWDSGQSYTSQVIQSKLPRYQQNTLLRLAVPVPP